MMRKIVIAVGAVVVLFAGALWYLASSVDGIVKEVIEESGSAATGTEVSVSGVRIHLREARGSIDGLRIANPTGFSGDAISFRSITIAIDPASIAGRDPIVVTEVRVQEPHVNLVLGNGGSNLQALLDNIRRGGGTKPPSSSSGGKVDAEEIRIRIDSLDIGKAQLSADLSKVGGKSYQATLPVIQRSGLGGHRGATATEIAETIARAFVQETLAAAARHETQHAVDKLIDKNLKGDAGAAAKGILGNLLGP